MPKLTERFNLGDRKDIDQDRLLDLLEEMYMQLAIAINRKPDVYFRPNDGVTGPIPHGDTFLANGDINVNTNTLKIEMLVQHLTPDTVTWKEI